jgi:DNA repair protein RecN (Recombination protein N)
MLKELRIRNYAIIDELAFAPRPGLTALTGETGAGKSILIGALGLTLGERAYSEMIRTGSDEASVEALFEASALPSDRAHGIDLSHGLRIRRTVSRAGKSRALVNETSVTLQALADIGGALVDLHGQHEHQGLLLNEEQLRLLDGFGGHGEELDRVATLYAAHAALLARLARLRMGAREREQRLDLLRYQVREIEAASPVPGEDVELSRERTILMNLSRLNELLALSYGTLYEQDGAVVERMAAVRSSVAEMAGVDDEASGVLDILDQGIPLLEEASLSLRTLRDKYLMDPARLTAVDDRLRVLEGLSRRYGSTMADVLAHRDSALIEIGELENSEESSSSLEREKAEAEEALVKAAAVLSEKRQAAARGLAAAIKKVLKELALEKADLRISLPEAPVSATGAETVEFLFSANAGEELKPLKRVASGGELSRIMLAIKSVMSRDGGAPVLIFDEVDAGIGGRTAENVARRLKALAEGRQVLCITHLPQIAARADFHFVIEKTAKGPRTSVSVREVFGQQRVEEIARMLSGRITETSLTHAREMLGESE